MRIIAIGIFLSVLLATTAYAASMTGAPSLLGLGTGTVPHCQVLDYDVAAADTITSVNARVECNVTGTYTVDATVTSGAASGTGQSAATSLTANLAAVVAVGISPSVAISASTYNADIRVKK